LTLTISQPRAAQLSAGVTLLCAGLIVLAAGLLAGGVGLLTALVALTILAWTNHRVPRIVAVVLVTAATILAFAVLSGWSVGLGSTSWHSNNVRGHGPAAHDPPAPRP
jgi:hypothetical protein